MLSFRFVTTRRQSYNRTMMFWSVSPVSLLAKISIVPKDWAVNLRVPAFWQWSGINEVNFLGFTGLLEYLISWFIGFSPWSTPFLHSLNNMRRHLGQLSTKRISKIALSKRVYQWHTSICHLLPHWFLLNPLVIFLCVSWLIVTLNNEKAFRPALDKKNFKDCTEQESLPVAYIHLSFASSLVSSKPLGDFLCVSWLIVTYSIPFSCFFHNFKDIIYNWW